MKTISERIEAALEELKGVRVLPGQLERNVLTRHFSEPWLNKPDGPGWWWASQTSDTPTILKVDQDCEGLFVRNFMSYRRWKVPEPYHRWQWQRVIRPSE